MHVQRQLDKRSAAAGGILAISDLFLEAQIEAEDGDSDEAVTELGGIRLGIVRLKPPVISGRGEALDTTYRRRGGTRPQSINLVFVEVRA